MSFCSSVLLKHISESCEEVFRCRCSGLHAIRFSKFSIISFSSPVNFQEYTHRHVSTDRRFHICLRLEDLSLVGAIPFRVAFRLQY